MRRDFMSARQVFNAMRSRGETIDLRQINEIATMLDIASQGTSGNASLSLSNQVVKSTTTLHDVPKEYRLYQNHPNPFNPSTVIRYDLSEESHVTLNVHNTLGQVVRTLVNETQNEGYKSVTFDASALPSGVYFYRLEATSVTDATHSFMQMKKMTLLK